MANYILYLENFNYITDTSLINNSIDLATTNELVLRTYEVTALGDGSTEFLESLPIITFPISAINTTTFSLNKEEYSVLSNDIKLTPIENFRTYINDGINIPPTELTYYDYIEYVPNSQLLRIKNLNFEYGATYNLTTTGLIGYLYNPTTSATSTVTIDNFNIRFTTTNSQLNKEFTKAFNHEMTDILSKIYNITNLLDVDKVLLDSDERYNFKHIPIGFNVATQDYREVSAEVEVDNSAKIEELFVKQYMNEYSNYFKDMSDLNNRSENSSLKTRYDVQILKTIIAKNVYLFNQFKGNKKGIAYILNLFCDALGYDLLSITENIYQNFSYTISSTLPKTFWEVDIKPIVHPIPWNCLYNEIEFNYKFPIVNWIKYHDLYHNLFEVLYERKSHYSYLEKFFELNNMNLNEYNDSNKIVSDASEEDEYRFSPASYTYQYKNADDDNSLEKDLRLKINNLESNILTVLLDTTINRYTFIYEPGYALEYTWEIYLAGVSEPIMKTRSKSNRFYATINNFNVPQLHTLTLTLHHYNYDYNVGSRLIG
jgi:hypothetical protein